MKRSDYRPGRAVQVRAERDGQRWTLVLTRELRHPPERVWAALTDPAQLVEWAPFEADHPLSQLGAATLTMVSAEERLPMQGVVRVAEAPRLLEYSWDKDLLRWELEPIPGGTRLTLCHTLDDREWLPKVTAGWHLCFDVAELYLAGTPIGRIVGGDAKNFGWERLNDEYAAQLGIESSGWPEGTPGAT